MDNLTSFHSLLRSQLSEADTKDFASTVLADARTTMDTSEGLIRTYALLIVGGSILFELLDRAEVPELSILGVRIQGTGFLLAITPVLIAAFYSQLLFNFAVHSWNLGIYGSAMRALYPALVDSGVADGLHVTGKTPISVAKQFRKYGNSPLAARLLAGLTVVIAGLLIVVPAVYLIWAYVRVFRGMGPDTVGIWIGLIVSVGLIALGVLSIMGDRITPKTPPSGTDPTGSAAVSK